MDSWAGLMYHGMKGAREMPKAKSADKTKADEKVTPPEKVPNATTRKAIREARRGHLTRWASLGEMIAKLGGSR
jgi:hypothetical protein